MKLNDCIRNTTAVRGNVATVTSYCNYCSVMQDIILRVTKSEFSRTILCLSSLSGKYTQSRITRTHLYRIIAYFEGHLLHQKSLH